jgi:hypothetical protein
LPFIFELGAKTELKQSTSDPRTGETAMDGNKAAGPNVNRCEADTWEMASLTNHGQRLQ